MQSITVRGLSDARGSRYADVMSLIAAASMQFADNIRPRVETVLGTDYGAVGAGDIDIMGALVDAITGGDDDELGAGDIDIVGASDLISSILEGGDDELGARHKVRRALAKKAIAPALTKALHNARAMNALRAVDPGAKVLRRADKYIHRRQNIGATTSVDVPAGGTFTITIQPQRPFKTMRWIVSSDIAFFFDITDVKVGQVSQFAASSVVPASSFTEQARDANLEWDTADIGNLIVISGTNVHSLAHPFRSNLIGTSLVPQY